MTPEEKQRLLRETEMLCRSVGAFIWSQRNAEKNAVAKNWNDFVTQIDRDSERMLVAGLRKIFPEAGFLTEEKTDSTEAPYRWVIDPLDGTTNFLHGVPAYAISVALCRGNKPVLGVIHEVAQTETFSASENGGAFCNGEPIRVRYNDELKDALIATGFPYLHDEKLGPYLELFNAMVRSSRGMRRIGAAALDMAYVACGRFDAFYEIGLQPWDVAAGIIIVREAGGKVYDFSGGDEMIEKREMICGSPAIALAVQQKASAFFGN